MVGLRHHRHHHLLTNCWTYFFLLSHDNDGDDDYNTYNNNNNNNNLDATMREEKRPVMRIAISLDNLWHESETSERASEREHVVCLIVN